MIDTERWETDHRYYQLLLSQDLLGDVQLVRNWGAKHSFRRGSRKDIYPDSSAALHRLKKLRARRRAHGYQLVCSAIPS